MTGFLHNNHMLCQEDLSALKKLMRTPSAYHPEGSVRWVSNVGCLGIRIRV